MSNTPQRQVERHWGRLLRERRIERGFTQVTFAAEVGQTQTTVSRYERGEGAWTPDVMARFAKALDTGVTDLFPWPEAVA